MTVRGPWYITRSAVYDYMRIAGIPDTDDGFERAEHELIGMAQDTVSSGRRPARLRSGALRYRGPRPQRLTFIVVETPRPEGDLPQLVRVLSSHAPAR